MHFAQHHGRGWAAYLAAGKDLAKRVRKLVDGQLCVAAAWPLRQEVRQSGKGSRDSA